MITEHGPTEWNDGFCSPPWSDDEDVFPSSYADMPTRVLPLSFRSDSELQAFDVCPAIREYCFSMRLLCHQDYTYLIGVDPNDNVVINKKCVFSPDFRKRLLEIDEKIAGIETVGSVSPNEIGGPQQNVEERTRESVPAAICRTRWRWSSARSSTRRPQLSGRLRDHR
ncbi:MAG: hypothetical protein ACOC0Y_02035 [Spirochaetota bacterium]